MTSNKGDSYADILTILGITNQQGEAVIRVLTETGLHI